MEQVVSFIMNKHNRKPRRSTQEVRDDLMDDDEKEEYEDLIHYFKEEKLSPPDPETSMKASKSMARFDRRTYTEENANFEGLYTKLDQLLYLRFLKMREADPRFNIESVVHSLVDDGDSVPIPRKVEPAQQVPVIDLEDEPKKNPKKKPKDLEILGVEHGQPSDEYLEMMAGTFQDSRNARGIMRQRRGPPDPRGFGQSNSRAMEKALAHLKRATELL